ncbi:MAG: acyl-CoA thioester hydrolase YciA [Rhodospirillales bacterium]|nr:acyl-CoA thioester hydrolase YciA [Rhodospirillales bacterium]MCW8861918.1 acyl-CoA thioester hydrolase YciA [Rhodospirillales bacterium]MCW8951382.1 acyl-CoA thioester hydrolase YciA [Rhodospirillales bacterium]MCW8971389.1 acyl-CoA thioester hydrolase YciA [Rhodospirillales bacterium]MCW9002345.1 acyl-CoA thioester hydrolase YciA [Rhodospirillales bacterium]
MTVENAQPRGQLAIRTLAMPSDTNPNGDVFGGWLMSQMDIAGGVTAEWVASGRVATVAVQAMKFHRPVNVGDVVCCYADIMRIGTTSITVLVEVWVLRKRDENNRVKVTEGEYTYVAIDDQGRPRPIRDDQSEA